MFDRSSETTREKKSFKILYLLITYECSAIEYLISAEVGPVKRVRKVGTSNIAYIMFIS